MNFHLTLDQVEKVCKHFGKELSTLEEYEVAGHRGKIPEQNSNGLCCKIKNQQMGPHKIAKLLQSKRHRQ